MHALVGVALDGETRVLGSEGAAAERRQVLPRDARRDVERERQPVRRTLPGLRQLRLEFEHVRIGGGPAHDAQQAVVDHVGYGHRATSSRGDRVDGLVVPTGGDLHHATRLGRARGFRVVERVREVRILDPLPERRDHFLGVFARGACGRAGLTSCCLSSASWSTTASPWWRRCWCCCRWRGIIHGPYRPPHRAHRLVAGSAGSVPATTGVGCSLVPSWLCSNSPTARAEGHARATRGIIQGLYRKYACVLCMDSHDKREGACSRAGARPPGRAAGGPKAARGVASREGLATCRARLPRPGGPSRSTSRWST